MDRDDGQRALEAVEAIRADVRRIKALVMIGLGFYLTHLFLQGLGQVAKHFF